MNVNIPGDIPDVISPELVDPYGNVLEPEFTVTVHDKTFKVKIDGGFGRPSKDSIFKEFRRVFHVTAVELVIHEPRLESISEIVGLDKIPSLTNLEITGTQISEFDDLAKIRSAPILRELFLFNNQINHIPDLNSFKNLESISLRDNQITHIPDLFKFVPRKGVSFDLRYNPIKTINNEFKKKLDKERKIPKGEETLYLLLD